MHEADSSRSCRQDMNETNARTHIHSRKHTHTHTHTSWPVAVNIRLAANGSLSARPASSSASSKDDLSRWEQQAKGSSVCLSCNDRFSLDGLQTVVKLNVWSKLRVENALHHLTCHCSMEEHAIQQMSRARKQTWVLMCESVQQYTIAKQNTMDASTHAITLTGLPIVPLRFAHKVTTLLVPLKKCLESSA